MKNSFIITGATGFIGRSLSRFLLESGAQVLGLSRHPEKMISGTDPEIPLSRWNPDHLDGWETVMSKAKVIINLAGESINRFRWTKGSKDEILKSRIRSCRILIEALDRTGNRPDLFIQISGTGFYGSRKNEKLDENAPPGSGFLSQVTRSWEDATRPLEDMNIRRVVLRTGIVLGRDGGVLKRLTLPFRFFLGSTFGSGNQWVPWIHVLDLCRAMDFIVSNRDLQGIFNLVSPNPVPQKEMTHSMGSVLHKPSFFNVPGWLVTLILGEMGRELLLSSQRAVPQKLLEAGFGFSFPHMGKALQDILN